MPPTPSAAARTYRVRWFDVAVSEVREDLVQLPPGEALAQRLASGIEAAGGVVLSTARVRESTLRWPRGGDALDVPWWCRELRTLVAAGMTVVEALETLNAQSLGAARAQVNAELVRLLREGQALSAAMASTRAFPAVLVAGVTASERTSALVEALDDYLRYDGMLQRLRKQVVSAAVYPCVVVAVGGLISMFLLLYVVPRFSRMYADLRGPVSATTRLLVGFSRLLAGHGLLVGAGVAAFALLAVIAWRRGWVRDAVATIAAHVAPLQAKIDEYRLAKLYHSLALMFRGGYPLDAAIERCVRLELGARIEAGLGRAQAALVRGARVSDALSEGGLTDVVSVRLLAVGERTGGFDRILQTIAERHAARFETFIERATRIVEPMLLLLVALLVGGIVIMMYMPVFDIASSIG